MTFSISLLAISALNFLLTLTPRALIKLTIDSSVSLLVTVGGEVAFFSLIDVVRETTLLEGLGLVNSLNWFRSLAFSSLIS